MTLYAKYRDIRDAACSVVESPLVPMTTPAIRTGVRSLLVHEMIAEDIGAQIMLDVSLPPDSLPRRPKAFSLSRTLDILLLCKPEEGRE